MPPFGEADGFGASLDLFGAGDQGYTMTVSAAGASLARFSLQETGVFTSGEKQIKINTYKRNNNSLKNKNLNWWS